MKNPQLQAFFEKLEAQGLMVTYDDVRLRTKYSEVVPSQADVRTRFSRRITLNIPIVSSPMDTVTTSAMAIAIGEHGGIGIIHRGLSPEIQAREVARVKHHLNGRIKTPITVHADMTVGEIISMREEKGYSFHTFPVVDASHKVIGLLTRNDFDFCTDLGKEARAIMTPFADLTKAPPDTEAHEAYELLLSNKKKVLPLVGTGGELAGMYIFSDLKRIFLQGNECNVDAEGQLVVGAAVGVGEGAVKRAELLGQEKCDVFHIDTAHGDSKAVIDTIMHLKKKYPAVDVAAGNVSSGESAKRLVDAGADAVLVGQGPGSICTTRVVAGVGVPQVSAIYECAEALVGSDVPVTADGGINNSGDMVIALAVGASSVMLGRLLAGTEEAPGETRFFQGMQIKDYRGMGSLGAMRANVSSRERYGQTGIASIKLVPEGIEGVVPFKGSVKNVLDQYVGGIRAGMGYNGVKTIAGLQEVAELFRISTAGLTESHPHDVAITAQAPNYQGRG